MRRFLVPALLLAAALAPALADDTPLTDCQGRIVAAGERLTTDRRRILGGCIADALGCDGALGGRHATNDPCLARVAQRCTAAMAGIADATVRVDGAGPHCTIVGGITPTALLGDDGLAFAQLAAFCPDREVDDTHPVDVARCQREALVCTEDGLLQALAPRGATILSHLGVSTDDGGPCLAAALCGNGEIDGDEACDDGAANSDVLPDHCRTTCKLPACGDGVVDTMETCDDGNQEDGDGCDAHCMIEPDVCGNGVIEDGEECDDGNQEDGDGCSSDCTIEADVCGNGILEGSEECDDGAANSDVLPDHCRSDCTLPVCGDGVVDPTAGETCEPPGTLVCDDTCQTLLGDVGAVRHARSVIESTPQALAHCQRSLVQLGSGLFAAERRLLDRCVLEVAHCVMDVEPNDSDGTRTDACFTSAQDRCDAMVKRRDDMEKRFSAHLAASCPLPFDAAVGAGGLDLGATAAACTFDGTSSPTVADVLGCVVERTHCLAENATARTIPLAYDLLGNLYDPDSDFPCVTDPLSVGG